MKLIKERLYEFERKKSAKETLALGKLGKIKTWFKNLGFTENDYNISDDGYVDVNKSIDLRYKPNITWIPKNLDINGHFILSGSNVSEIPEGTIVHGSMNIVNTKIKDLPEDLVVYGLLSMNKGQIDDVPKNVEMIYTK